MSSAHRGQPPTNLLSIFLCSCNSSNIIQLNVFYKHSCSFLQGASPPVSMTLCSRPTHPQASYPSIQASDCVPFPVSLTLCPNNTIQSFLKLHALPVILCLRFPSYIRNTYAPMVLYVFYFHLFEQFTLIYVTE